MRYFLVILFVVFIAGCQPENEPGSILNGKIKTLDWRSATSSGWVQYEFIYDSLGNLIKVKGDSLDYLLFDVTSDSVRMIYHEPYGPMSLTFDKRIALDLQKRISSIHEFDTFSSLFDLNYLFAYNNDTLYWGQESYIPFAIFYPDRDVTDYGHRYVNGNCVEFYADWGGLFIPGMPVDYHDTIQYTFTSMVNDGQIPMQFPLRSIRWNELDMPVEAQGSNILYMLGLKGLRTIINKNLINTIKFAGSETYTFKFDYVTTANRVMEMTITNLDAATLSHTFKMTYYD